MKYLGKLGGEPFSVAGVGPLFLSAMFLVASLFGAFICEHKGRAAS